jgi:hypothetical protein
MVVMYIIQYVESPIGISHPELFFELAETLLEAEAKAKANLPKVREMCGANGYRIVDKTGRQGRNRRKYASREGLDSEECVEPWRQPAYGS